MPKHTRHTGNSHPNPITGTYERVRSPPLLHGHGGRLWELSLRSPPQQQRHG